MTAAAAALDDDVPMADSERRCLGTGEVRPRVGMLRFVVAPDPALGLVPDLAGDLPGRGLWVSADRTALERALARNAFARAARGPLRIAPDLSARVEAGLVRRLVDWLGLARRAGAAVAGFEKTRAALARCGDRYWVAGPQILSSPASLSLSAGPGKTSVVVAAAVVALTPTAATYHDLCSSPLARIRDLPT